MTSANDVVAEVVELMTPVLAPWKALSLADAKKETGRHVQVTAARTYVPTQRGGRDSREGWRLSTRVVGPSDYDANQLESDVDAALNGAEIVVDGRRSTAVRREGSTSVAPDDGMYSARTTWTFAL